MVFSLFVSFWGEDHAQAQTTRGPKSDPTRGKRGSWPLMASQSRRHTAMSVSPMLVSQALAARWISGTSLHARDWMGYVGLGH